MQIHEVHIDRTEGRNSNMRIIGYFNTPFSINDRISREKISKETGDLNNTIYQTDLTDLIEDVTQQQQKTHFTRVYTESDQGYITLGHKTSRMFQPQ